MWSRSVQRPGVAVALFLGAVVSRGEAAPGPAAPSPELDPRNVGLAGPHGLARGPAGEIYVASPELGRVFKLSPAGRLTIVAGHAHWSIRHLFFFNREHGLPDPRTDLRDGRAAFDAPLIAPTGLALDRGGNLFVSDAEDGRVFRVDAAAGTLKIVAGGGTVQGDAGPATGARLARPTGLALSANGDLLIADAGDHRVRRVDQAGRISTLAGDGLPGDRGDGGPADRARLSSPEGVAVDARGDLFIADRANHRIRRVAAATGVISTVAGTGTAGSGGDRGKPTTAQLEGPTGVSVDGAGNLLIADRGNHRVRNVAPGGSITTFAAQLGATADPYAVLADGRGGVLVSDVGAGRVQRITARGEVVVLAGDGGIGFSGDGGPARDARLVFPQGLAVDRHGNVYVADANENRVRRIDAATGTITTVAGDGRSGFAGDGGPAKDALLHGPAAVAVDATGSLLISDTWNHRVRKVADGVITTLAGNGLEGSGGDGGPATAAQLMRPGGIGVDSAGSLYIVDSGNGSLRRVDAAGQITTLVHTERRDLQALAVGPGGDIFVATNDRPQVFRYDRDMNTLVPAAGSGAKGFNGDGMPAVEAALGDWLGLALDGAGHLLIADFKNHRLRRVDAAGLITTVAGTGEQGRSPQGGPALQAILSPLAVAVHPDGAVFVSDAGGYVFRIERDGTITKVAGGGFGF